VGAPAAGSDADAGAVAVVVAAGDAVDVDVTGVDVAMTTAGTCEETSVPTVNNAFAVHWGVVLPLEEEAENVSVSIVVSYGPYSMLPSVRITELNEPAMVSARLSVPYGVPGVAETDTTCTLEPR
jgi:hypothetical protein